MKKRNALIAVSWALVAICMGVIFYLSSQNADDSAMLSDEESFRAEMGHIHHTQMRPFPRIHGACSADIQRPLPHLRQDEALSHLHLDRRIRGQRRDAPALCGGQSLPSL